MSKTDYERHELISICEDAIVREDFWDNRDSYSAQSGVGYAWAMLRAGVPFQVLTEGNLVTDDKTIWLEFRPKGFSYFDHTETREIETVYLPTPESLRSAQGRDWY